MKVLIAYQGDNKTNAQVAETMKKVFEENGAEVKVEGIRPTIEMRLYDYIKEFKKKKKIEFKKATTDVKSYDLVVIGTPVLKFSPTPLMETYVRSLKNTKGKKFVLYCTPVGFAGSTIKRLANILATKGGLIVSTLTISSIFELNEEKLARVKSYTQQLINDLKQ
ncbi:MAG: NAD(P)H-dependent oxidoreductase [Candidatus Diapherotrites archaeon]